MNKKMNIFLIVIFLMIISIIIVIFYRNQKETFLPVVPSDLFPGTYWRNNSLRQSDQCCSNRGIVGCRPAQSLDVEFRAPVISPSSFGQDCQEYRKLPVRYPEPRFEMVCSVNDHLQRNCYWKKVYNNYY